MNPVNIGTDQLDFEPRVRRPVLTRYPPLKTTIAAIILLLGGILFISLGLSIFFSHDFLIRGKDRGIMMIILGGLSKFSFIHHL
jgi:hypothetical protein